ncbi:DNA-binding FrmR family transcriptional regulator [Chitinivorax tropicus]|uniref:DNA-binding FrmR family transcriptional regulator n=1 Tax=Chitinivorax tropicus TaxID=714531 RepID=A0A840MQX4_9PROT|nr:metal-sensitive transcriptional regulator [Chitinivorax tropicus]MBB5019497.1 DNA-binding FrmR family transcriptional regulator [Chitinivorax tropicus]
MSSDASESCCTDSALKTVQPHKRQLLQRLKRVEGQVRGIANMVEADRYCVDVLTQVQAARAALDAVSLQIMQDHLRGCVQKAVQQGEGERVIQEMVGLLAKWRG